MAFTRKVSADLVHLTSAAQTAGFSYLRLQRLRHLDSTGLFPNATNCCQVQFA